MNLFSFMSQINMEVESELVNNNFPDCQLLLNFFEFASNQVAGFLQHGRYITSLANKGDNHKMPGGDRDIHNVMLSNRVNG